MVETQNIIVDKVSNSRLDTLDFENIQFGKMHTDHMVDMDYIEEKWSTPHIKPYQNLQLSPACSGLHYGQSIFEGMKAYHYQNGKVALFRPEMNAKRFNKSATRMGMANIDESVFVNSIKALLDLDRSFMPKTEGTSLYIRPYMFGNDSFIGVRTSQQYKFLIFCMLAGAYYSKPVNVLISDFYSRSMNGGTGFAKAAGNYAATMYPTSLAKKEKFDQILWTDSVEHKYIQEIGTMNVFFIVDGKAVTPAIDGNILEGITRDSVMTLLKDEGIEVIEKPLTVDEIKEASKNGSLQEAFGTGTAASVAFIASLNHNGEKIEFADKEMTIGNKMKTRLDNIKYGIDEDKFNWIVEI